MNHQDSNDKTNCPYKLLSTDTKISRISKAFANGSLANVKVSKTHLFKMKQSGGLFADLIKATSQVTFHH